VELFPIVGSNIDFETFLCKKYLFYFPTILNRVVLTNRNELQNPCSARSSALMNKLCSKVRLRIQINLC